VEDAWNAFHALLRLDPNSALGHHMVGLIALRTGRLEMGVESLRRSITLDPSDPAAYGNLGNGLRDLGRTDEALQAYGTALAMAHSLLDALNSRAQEQGRRVALLHNDSASVLRSLGRHAEALDGCAAALRADPSYGDAHLNRATVLSDLGRYEEALADYEACLAVDPGRPEALFHSATAYLALGDYERGWERYETRMDLQGMRRIVPDIGFTQPIWTGGPL
jgi:tetratricopeptide (TPR) repeat protein